MKKVINITLGSIVFAIEQDAYDALASYLDQIKHNLTSVDDASEVLADIESAIAEKFILRKRNKNFAVTSADVDAVVSEMGSPADFGEGEGEDAGETASAQTEAAPKKGLYRDTDDAIIAGVASGLARYFDIDPVLVRLIFFIAIFFNGAGILAYIILWLVVPVATTTADKYAMRGERVTLKDISERVKKNIQSIDSSKFETTKGLWAKMRGVLDTLFRALGRVLKAIFVVIHYVASVVIVLAGALGVAGVVSAYSILLLSERVLLPAQAHMALETLQSSALGIIAIVSSFIVVLIPFLVFLIAGSGLLAKRNYFTVQKTVTLAVTWIVAAALAGTTSVLLFEHLMQNVGPVEGRFDDSSFHIEWEDGVISGDEEGVRFIHERSDDEEVR